MSDRVRDPGCCAWRPRKSGTVVSRRYGDEWLVFDSTTSRRAILDGVAAAIWEGVLAQRPVPLIAQELSARFDVAPRVAREDTWAFLGVLASSGLVMDNGMSDDGTESEEGADMLLGTSPQQLTSRLGQRGNVCEAVLELTHRCNQACQHCYQNSQTPEKLSKDDWYGVLDDLLEAGCWSVAVSGGEPTLVPFWCDLVEYAASCDCTVEVKTNGTLLTDESIERLARWPAAKVTVSIAGARAESHDRVVSLRGSFVRIVETVRRLKQCGVPTSVVYVLQKSTFDEVDGIRALCGELDVELRIEDKLTDPAKGARGFDRLRPSTEQLRQYYLSSSLPAQLQGRMWMCQAGSTVCAIDPEGTLFPCVAFRLPIGNVLASPFTELWADNEVLRELRGARWEDFAGCCACTMASICNFCPGEAYSATGVWLDPEAGQCRHTKVLWELGVRASAP